MGRIRLVKFLFIILFILPVFFDHWNILPGATKYTLDLCLITYFILYKPIFGVNNKGTSFHKIYLFYVSLSMLAVLFSILIHHESFFFFFEEFRRLIYPLLIYIIFSDVMYVIPGASVKLHKWLMFILYLQIPVTIFQVLTYSKLKSMGLFANRLAEMDVAEGTVGLGGTSLLGILIPLTFVYLYDFRKIIKWLPLIIPFIIINSGGGIILFLFILSMIIIEILFQYSFKLKSRLIFGIVVLAMAYFALSSLTFFSDNIATYEKSFIRYYENYVLEDNSTFIGEDQGHKIDRLKGYKFLMSHMNPHNFENLIGLGFKFQENPGGLPYQYKNDINFIIAERGFIGLILFFAMNFIFLASFWFFLIRMNYGNRLIKLLLVTCFFLASFYNPTTRMLPVWTFVIYFIALLENPHQYTAVSHYYSNK